MRVRFEIQLVDVFLWLLLLFVIMCNCADDGLVIVVVMVVAAVLKVSESCRLPCAPCALPASFRLASLLAYKGICCCCCCCRWLLFSFLINTLTNYALLAFLHIVIVIVAASAITTATKRHKVRTCSTFVFCLFLPG